MTDSRKWICSRCRGCQCLLGGICR